MKKIISLFVMFTVCAAFAATTPKDTSVVVTKAKTEKVDTSKVKKTKKTKKVKTESVKKDSVKVSSAVVGSSSSVKTAFSSSATK